MAKIYKVYGYIVVPDDVYEDEDHLKNMLMTGVKGYSHNFKIKSKDIDDWNDDNPLKYEYCFRRDCEKYFR